MPEQDKLYVFLPYGSEWEDHKIFLNEQAALTYLIKQQYRCRVEIFIKHDDGSFIPSYKNLKP
jgi:hypothetical protein